jgi:hypothetical protein
MEAPERYFYDKDSVVSSRPQWYYKSPNGKYIRHRIEGPQDISEPPMYTAYYFMVNDKLLCSFYLNRGYSGFPGSNNQLHIYLKPKK